MTDKQERKTERKLGFVPTEEQRAVHKKDCDMEDIIKDCVFFNRCCDLYDEGFTEIFESSEWKKFLCE